MAVPESTVTDEGSNSSHAKAAKVTTGITEIVAPTVTPTVTPTEAPTVTPTEAPTVTPTEAPTVTPTGTPTEAPDTKEGSNNGKRSTSGGSKQEDDDTETERAPNATPTKTSATEEEFKRRATTKTIADSRSTRTPLFTKSSGERTTARKGSGGGNEDENFETASSNESSDSRGVESGGGPTSDSYHVTGPDGKTEKYASEDSESEYGDDGITDTNHSRPGDISESTGSRGQNDKDTSSAENPGSASNKYNPTDYATKTPEGTAAGTTKDPKQPNTVATQDLKQSSSKTANYPEKQTAEPDQSPEDPVELNSKYGDSKTLGDDKHSVAGNNPPTTEKEPNDGMGENGGAAATAAVATDTNNTNADPADNDYTTTNTKTDTNSDKENPTGSSAGAKSAGAKSTGVDGDDGSNYVPRCNSTSGRRCIFPYHFNMAVSSKFLLKAEIPRRNQFSM